MATIKLTIDTRTVKNGMCPVKIRINHKFTSTYVATGVSVEPNYFRPEDFRQPISPKAPSAKIKNEQIASLIRKFDEVVFELQRNDELDRLTAKDIRTYIIGERTPARKPIRKPMRKAQARGRIDFLDYFDKYGKEKLTENTRRHYDYVWGLLKDFCKENNMQTLYFDDLNYCMLKKIRDYALNGRTDCTRYKVEAYMHAAYTEAEKMGMVSRDDNPYYTYTIEPEKRNEDIDTIDIKDLRNFLSLDLTNQQGVEGLSKARDILWASFCLCGVNLCDIYHMNKVHDNEIVYIRRKNRNRRNVRKTHAAITMDVEAIIERYAGKDYLFRFQEDTPNYYTFQRRLNNRCERLSKLNGAKINMQLIRRTWSTIAGDIGVDWHTVDKSIGHMDKTTTDIHYMKFNWQKAAKQNQRVIDYVLRGVVPNSVKVPKIFRNK